jgi:hypothetical protein
LLIKNQCWDPNVVTHALKIADHYKDLAETMEQKNWVIDQMVRALTYCPIVIKQITINLDEIIEVEILGESQAYLMIASDQGWNKGTPV